MSQSVRQFVVGQSDSSVALDRMSQFRKRKISIVDAFGKRTSRGFCFLRILDLSLSDL